MGEVEREPSAQTSSPRSLGRYRIVAELARGGMGVVYLALVRGPGSFNKLLVLKELKPELLEDPGVLAMFLEEARLAACLSHANVVQTIEAGSDGDRHYIAMEYLSGQPLHRLVGRAQKRGVPLPVELQCGILCEALEGLAYAHTATDYDGRPLGIVHRDVSPHNIFIGYDGQTKVLDFGIAKAMNSSVETRTGVLKGKVAYMAPEQAAGGNVDARADLFAVGVMLYEAATGRRFWADGGGDGRILRALILGEWPLARPGALDGVPLPLRAVIEKATALAPEQRYESAAAMLWDLRAALSATGLAEGAHLDVGQLLQKLFAEDRARLQAAIEETLSFYRGPASGAFPAAEVPSFSPLLEMPSLSALRSERTPSTNSARAAATATGPSTTLASAAPEASSRPVLAASMPRRSRFAWSVGGAALTVGALILAVRGRGAASHAPVTPVLSDSTPVAVSPQEPVTSPSAPAQSVRVIVRASPPNARISMDGQGATENPWVGFVPKGGETHTVRLEAEGFTPREELFQPVGDTTLVIALEPRKGPVHPGTANRAAVTTPVVPTALAAAPAPVTQSAASSVHVDPTPAPTAPGSVPQRRINPANPYAH